MSNPKQPHNPPPPDDSGDRRRPLAPAGDTSPTSNPRARHATGRAGEDLAARYLQRQGCRIVARRFGKRGGEIDLVIDDGGVIVFVEVKARRSERYGAPVSAVTVTKRRRIVATARAFLAARRWRSRRCRFDIVAVRLGGGRAAVTWYRDAFRP